MRLARPDSPFLSPIRLLCLSALSFGVAGIGHASDRFPVRSSDNGRYLVQADGTPFPILGRSSWFMTTLSMDDIALYLDDSAARGINTVETLMIGHDPRGRHGAFDQSGEAPFLKCLNGADWDGNVWSDEQPYGDPTSDAPDFTTPNEVYWKSIDKVLDLCADRGFLVLIFPAYVGYAGYTAQGWMTELEVNGYDRMRTYGEWVGKRYKDQPNIVWMLGGDHGGFNEVQAKAEQGLIDGLLAGGKGGTLKLRSAEWRSGWIGTDDPDFARYMTLNGAYDFDGYSAYQGRRAYAHTPVMPAYYLEGPYDEEFEDGTNVNPSASQPVRRFQWWGWLGSIGGHIAGNGYVWPFQGDVWKEHLDTQGAKDVKHLNSFINSIAWWKLVPCGIGGQRQIITRGESQSKARDYLASAASLDGTLLVAYTPPARWGPFEVDMTVLCGPGKGRWYDPSSGEYTEIEGELPNTGRHTFQTPGKNSRHEDDWVLLIEAQPEITD